MRLRVNFEHEDGTVFAVLFISDPRPDGRFEAVIAETGRRPRRHPFDTPFPSTWQNIVRAALRG